MTSVVRGVVAHPRASLLRNALWSVLLFSIPLYGALYILGGPRGSWLVLLGTQLLGIGLCGLVWKRYRSISVIVTDSRIEEQGLFFRRRFPVADIRAVTLFQIYRSSSAEVQRQLVVVDGQDKRLLRMRGMLWSEWEMRRVAEAIGVPLAEPTEILTARSFAVGHPQYVDWYERNRLLAGVVLTALLVAAIGVVVGLMALAGVPLGAAA
jgi:hypothetical protein